MGDESSEDGPFVRPFMSADQQPGSAARSPVLANPGEASEEGSTIRPYLLTGGRVHDSDDAVEKIYQGTGRSTLGLSREHAKLLDLCQEAQSVAEISAHLNLPLGVVAVLARDLYQAGLLTSSAEDIDGSSDVSILLRLKDAIRSL